MFFEIKVITCISILFYYYYPSLTFLDENIRRTQDKVAAMSEIGVSKPSEKAQPAFENVNFETANWIG